MTARASVAVIVPTFRRPGPVERCLRAIAAQTTLPDRVVVAVRQDDVETVSALERLSAEAIPFECVTVCEPGVMVAIAAAVRRCQEDVVAHVDDDAVPRRDWLERLLAGYGPGIGGVGGRDVLLREDPPARQVGKLSWYGRLYGNHHIGTGPPRDVDVLKGACMSLRRELWRPDGALRGRGAQVHWELAMCLRARRDGWRLLYDPSIQVDHDPAPRHDEDDREEPTERARADAEWNYVYALVRWLPVARAAVAVTYASAVGTTNAPGLVALLMSLRTRGGLRASVRLFSALTRARMLGLGTAVERRARVSCE